MLGEILNNLPDDDGTSKGDRRERERATRVRVGGREEGEKNHVT